jgi:hypothetical protein
MGVGRGLVAVQGEFWKEFWRVALPVLGLGHLLRPTHDEALEERPKRRIERGRREAEVWEREANKAAQIYMRDRELNAYAVWTRYNPGQVKQSENPKLLSKNMIGHLVTAIDRGWLPWDTTHKRLVISGEFRAGSEKLVIPRGKPAS